MFGHSSLEKRKDTNKQETGPGGTAAIVGKLALNTVSVFLELSSTFRITLNNVSHSSCIYVIVIIFIVSRERSECDVFVFVFLGPALKTVCWDAYLLQ